MLVSQLVFGIACRIENRIAISQMNSFRLGPVRAQWRDWHDSIVDAKGQAKLLMTYVANSQTVMGSREMLGLTSDKIHAGGLPLINTVFLNEDNVVAMACPVVRTFRVV